MTNQELIKNIEWRISQTSVGPSTVRNQGSKGVVKNCRKYLSDIKSEEFFNSLRNKEFSDFLNFHTERLITDLPTNAQRWGIARKVLNIYFRGLIYNKFICDHYGSDLNNLKRSDILSQMEVPLDSYSAKELRKKFPDLPKWTTIKELTPEKSELFQLKAKEYGKEEEIAPVHLDLIFWRQ